jgi:RNA polymerase sigma factor (sigma-70 family)
VTGGEARDAAVSEVGPASDNGLVSREPAEPTEAAEPVQSDEAALVARAVDGDKAALEEVIRLLSDPLYRLALRMVWRPADAEDATQEILIRVLTRLASWRGEARLLTWAYRIGVNYLLNLRRKTPQEAQQFSLDEFRASLADGLADADYRGPEAAVLAEEVRLSCTQAMLQCLERGERIAFVLSDIFELSSAEAAWIIEITPAAYRKRLERARHRIGAFMNSTCGVVNPAAFCRCARRVPKAVASGRIDPSRPAFTDHPVTPSGRGVAEAAAQLHRLHDAAAVMRAHPDYAAPQAKIDAIAAMLHSGRFPLLE